MKPMYILTLALLFPFFTILAQTTDSSTHLSEYSGQEIRTIKSLSEEDIKELLNGEGWGLAMVAELNGIPGPRHVLDMGAEINLTENQKLQLETFFSDMKADATALGQKYVALEKELNESFVKREIDDAGLKDLLMKIAHVTYKLRYTHLLAHLKTVDVLTDEQVEIYNQLRGYGSGDPCSNVPEGHDAELWKKHNGCN